MLKKNNFQFTKYKTCGSDYHYQEINKLNLLKFNAYLWAKYQIVLGLLEKYFKKIKSPQPLKILDVGCGDGVVLYLIKNRFPYLNLNFYGIDPSEEALKIARKKIPHGNFYQQKAENLKFKPKIFDIVISTDVIEHLKNPEIMLKQIKKVVKKTGLVIIGTPIRFTEKPQDKFHYREFFPDELKKMVKKYFSKIKLIKSHPLLVYLLYRQPINFFGKKIFLFYLLINFLTIFFKINPFLLKNKEKIFFYSYVYLICAK